MKMSATKVVILAVYGIACGVVGAVADGCDSEALTRCQEGRDGMRTGFTEALHNCQEGKTLTCERKPDLTVDDAAQLIMKSVSPNTNVINMVGASGLEWVCTRQ